LSPTPRHCIRAAQALRAAWQTKGESATLLNVALKTCSVSCNDLQDVLHTVEVTAETLYDAVAKALVIFRQNDWVADIGTGMTPVTVVVKEPTVMHQVLMKDFERWLKRNGRSPAEAANRSALRKQLGV